MKAFILLAFCSCFFVASAQQPAPDSVVEFRLQLVENINGAPSAISLQVSLINHSNKNIYLPGLSLPPVHLYEQVLGKWVEIDLFRFKPYKPIIKDSSTSWHLLLEATDEALKRTNSVMYAFKDSTRNYYRSQLGRKRFYFKKR